MSVPSERAETGQSPARDAVAEVWQQHRSGVHSELEALEDAVATLLAAPADTSAHGAASRYARRLAGSIGTFGFFAAARVAADVDRLLRSVPEISDIELLRLSELVVRLRDEINTGETRLASKAPARAGAILLATLDDDLRAEVVREARGRGAHLTIASSAEEVTRALAGDVAVCIYEFEDLPAVADALRSTEPRVPSIVVAEEATFIDRVAAARNGARAFLTRPVTARRLLDEAERVGQTIPTQALRAIVVSGDPSTGKVVEDLLSGFGIVPELIDSHEVEAALGRVGPDLLILDFDVKDGATIEICKGVRNDPAWSTLPIVFMTGRRDAETLGDIFAAGADDFIMKPVVGPELLARVTARLDRLRLWRELTERDPLTGLTNRRRAGDELERLFAASRTTSDVVAVAVIDVDHLRVANDAGGFQFGDRILVRLAELLKRDFPFDVVSRWAGEEFVVGMYGTTATDAVLRVADLLDEFRHEELRHQDHLYLLTFSAGVAEFPLDGDGVDNLMRSARAAMREAKRGGGARVLPATQGSKATDRLDVLVAEGDEELARLITSALTERGYTAEHVTDGDAAIARSTNGDERTRPRLLLLDVDLPGIDGITVLRTLRSEGVLDDMDVMMVAGRPGELELMRAMELGAVDHITTPFTVPTFMERVRRSLRTTR
ncbi:MAG TPA: response regulator [Actinomycetota bacterium]|nr:response regulator [Actinomycetota bacterium]